MHALSQFFLRKAAFTTSLFCCIVLVGCSFAFVAAGVDFNASKMAPQDQQREAIVVPAPHTLPTSQPTYNGLQAPFDPLVPYALQSENQTAAQVTSSGARVTFKPIAGNESTNRPPSAAATSQDTVPQNPTFITSVMQPESNNASLATTQDSHGGSLNGLVTLTVLSYAAAGVVLSVMRYWSFSFNEDEESPGDSRSSGQADADSAGYSTLEAVDYQRIV